MSEKQDAALRFVVVGKALSAAFKKLRVAYPTKREAPLVVATFKVEPTAVEIGLPGAVVSVPCEATASFTAQIPFEQFRQVEGDIQNSASLVRFAFAAGSMSIGGITVNEPSILVSAPKQNAALASSPTTEVRGNHALAPNQDPLDSPLGFPLLGAYRRLRLYPDPTIDANSIAKNFDARLKVEAILKKADKLLQPLGLTRQDIERVLDERLGISK